jgi:hypothetical protein
MSPMRTAGALGATMAGGGDSLLITVVGLSAAEGCLARVVAILVGWLHLRCRHPDPPVGARPLLAGAARQRRGGTRGAGHASPRGPAPDARRSCGRRAVHGVCDQLCPWRQSADARARAGRARRLAARAHAGVGAGGGQLRRDGQPQRGVPAVLFPGKRRRGRARARAQPAGDRGSWRGTVQFAFYASGVAPSAVSATCPRPNIVDSGAGIGAGNGKQYAILGSHPRLSAAQQSLAVSTANGVVTQPEKCSNSIPCVTRGGGRVGSSWRRRC